MAAAEWRFGRMMALAKAATAEQRKVDDGFIDSQRGTVAPAETQAVVAAESGSGVHGFFRPGGSGEETGGGLRVERLARHALLADQEIHRMAFDQTPVELGVGPGARQDIDALHAVADYRQQAALAVVAGNFAGEIVEFLLALVVGVLHRAGLGGSGAFGRDV